MKLGQTPSQTIGPFFAYGLVAEQYGYPNSQVANGVIAGEGERITIHGQVLDGNNAPIVDALVEIWDQGVGFARVGTGAGAAQGFTINTVKPLSHSLTEAPSFTVVLFMRGLLSHLYTRIYFSDDAEANDRDSVLGSLPSERRQTLVARCVKAGEYRYDIHLQGENETVFFDI
jgi:protocatechuate 3,4-dioxygenase alpha subunit